MKKIIYWTFFIFCVIISVALVKIITVESGTNDCMIEYIKSEKWNWYIYKIWKNMYHIDTEQYPGLKQVWIANWCLMVTYDKKLSFMALSNTLYCWVASIVTS